jgi:CBS domain-containing protein
MSDRIHKVLEIKGRGVVTTTPTTTVLAAIQQMNQNRIGSLVVIEDALVVGIFTERDVLARVVARGCDPSMTLVGEVMTSKLVTVSRHTTVDEAMRIVTDHRCRHLPVMDGQTLCGLISAGDLTSWVVRAQQRQIHDLHDYIRAA